MKLRLTSRIVLIFVLFSGILLAVVGFLSYRSGRAAMQTAAVAETLSIALEKEAQLQSWFDQTLAMVAELSKGTSLLGNLSWLQQSSLDPEAYALAKDRIRSELQPNVDGLHSSFLELAIANYEDGKVLVSTTPANEGASLLEENFFKRGRLAFFMDGPRFSEESGQPVMIVATPVLELDRTIGVFVARVNLGQLLRTVERRTGLRETDETFLVTAAGFPVTRPRLMSDPGVMRRPMESEAVKLSLRRNSGVVMGNDYRGVPSVSVYRWLSTRELGLIVNIHQSEAFAPSQHFAGSVTLITILALATAIGIAYWLAHGITKPIRDLQNRVAKFGRGERDQLVERVFSTDELGLLGREFSEMARAISAKETELRANSAELQKANHDLQLEVAERQLKEIEIERINKELVETSRQAGMAEVASSVLHNIGNVLNSVNVSCSLIAIQLRKSRISSVRKTADLLQEQSGDLSSFFANDPRGKQLPGFIDSLASKLAEEQGEMLREIQLLGENINHIKVIVAMQQNYAGLVAGVIEVSDVTGIVEDAIRLNADKIAERGIEMVREFEPVPPIATEKHKVLQILVNLIRNAQHAVLDGGNEPKRIVVTVSKKAELVIMRVSDNGIGIRPENLTLVFSYGFTTKKEGHGFGLHSSVLAARGMGGDLSVVSDGLGKGATFTLELPLREQT